MSEEMGRKGSRLIPFFMNALLTDKYVNLKFVGNTKTVFSLDLPKKSLCVDKNYQQILKDWKNLKGGNYGFTLKEYAEAKRGMEANIRRSEFLERLQPGLKNKLICRILDPEEVKAKKLLKKTKKISRNNSFENGDQPPSSVESSGYGSGVDSSVYSSNDEGNYDFVPTHAIKHDESNHALLYALEHDHEYMITASNSDNVEPMELDCVANSFTNEATSVTYGLTTDQLPENKSNSDIGNASLAFNMESFNSCHLAGDVASSNSSNLVETRIFGEKLSDLKRNSSVGNSSKDALSELFEIDESLTPSPDSPEVKELFKSLCNDLLDLKNSSMENEVLPAIGPPSCKVQICKVYKYSNRQDLNGIILLIFEPKLMELSFLDHQDDSTTNIKEPSTLNLIFDEATMKVMSSCIIEEIKLLNNDYILVILKCNESINNDFL